MIRMIRQKLFLFFMAFSLIAAPCDRAQAAVRLPHIFGDNMVLQQGMELPVWGWATPGEKVTVEIAGQQQSATAGANGQWRIHLKNLLTGPALEMTIRGENKLVLKNILVGEVWLCSGQSNMVFQLRMATDGQTAQANANHPEMRLFRVKDKFLAKEPQNDCEGEWVVCAPETAAQFSAVGYYFGQALRDHLKTPVGLIQSAVGGTTIQSWMDGKTLLAMPGGEKCLMDREKQYAEIGLSRRQDATGKHEETADFPDGMARQLKLTAKDIKKPAVDAQSATKKACRLRRSGRTRGKSTN